MGTWTDAVEAKARIIHGQMAAARTLALRNDVDPGEVERHYFDLLSLLYSDEFPFASLVDSSDLVARFEGPAVSGRDPTVSVVTSMCSELRKQIQGIARSIVGLESDERVRWPTHLDPQLAGITRGSLVIGVRIQPADESSSDQLALPHVSEPVVEAVRSAVRSLATVARHVGDEGLDKRVEDALPDPAVRDTVTVAASRLAPSGRRGIKSLSLYEPDSFGVKVAPLTPRSRKVLGRAVHRPVRVGGRGTFEGMVREVDLDARRFEIRNVAGVGAIRCVYSADVDRLVREILDARIQVEGDYETLPNRKPRLLKVSALKVVDRSSSQGELFDHWTEM